MGWPDCRQFRSSNSRPNKVEAGDKGDACSRQWENIQASSVLSGILVKVLSMV